MSRRSPTPIKAILQTLRSEIDTLTDNADNFESNDGQRRPFKEHLKHLIDSNSYRNRRFHPSLRRPKNASYELWLAKLLRLITIEEISNKYRKDIDLQPIIIDLYNKVCTTEAASILQKVKSLRGDNYDQMKHDINSILVCDIGDESMDLDSSPVQKTRMRKAKVAVNEDAKYTAISEENAWDHWQLQIITGDDYQSFVLDYIQSNRFTFVDVTSPVNPKTGYHCLLSPNVNLGGAVDLDIIAAEEFKQRYKNHLIPCRIKITNQKLDKKGAMLIPDKPNYGLAIHWDLKSFFAGTKFTNRVAGYNPELVQARGFRGYNFQNKGTLDEIQEELIDPVEQARRCVKPNGMSSIPLPQNLMKDNEQLQKAYIIADTHHDFGLTSFQETYIAETLTQEELSIMLLSRKTAGSVDEDFIEYINKTYMRSDVPIMLTPVDEDYKMRVCQQQSALIKRDTRRQQTVLDNVAGSDNTGVFVNFGGSQDIFDPSLQRRCAATRLEGTKTGDYMENDSKYGFNETELMHFDKVVVHNGSIYLYKKQRSDEIVSRLPFTASCRPKKEEANQQAWLQKCVCSLSEVNDTEKITIARAFYDLKRIADGLVIKAAIHHNGVMLSHDKLAILGARLYGCPTIHDSGNVIITYPKNVGYQWGNIGIERDPSTPNTPAVSQAPFAIHIGQVRAASTVGSQILGRGIKRAPSDVSKPIENTTKRRQVYKSRRRDPNAPEPEDDYNFKNFLLHKQNAEKAEEHAKAAKEAFVALLMKHANLSSQMDSYSGGAPYLTIHDPSHFLINCLIELLVLQTSAQANTSKRDFVAEAFEHFLTAEPDMTYMDAASASQYETSIVQLLRMAYANRFGISNAADHAFAVFTDPYLSKDIAMDSAYYIKLLQLVERVSKETSVSIQRSMRATARSAPVPNAPRTLVPSKVRSADNARRHPTARTQPIDAKWVVKPVSRSQSQAHYTTHVMDPMSMGMAM